MTPKVEFHFDFGSPNAYFAHKVIPRIEQRTGVKFQYVPILLGGVFKLANNASPIVQFKDTKAKLDYMKIETRRFIKKHGLSRFRMNPHFPVNTIQVMRGAVAAGMDGQSETYVDAVFR
jgi:2-hydroxychromene-2-carboxylate isomerase